MDSGVRRKSLIPIVVWESLLILSHCFAWVNAGRQVIAALGLAGAEGGAGKTGEAGLTSMNLIITEANFCNQIPYCSNHYGRLFM
jgi:hypothetical protein